VQDKLLTFLKKFCEKEGVYHEFIKISYPLPKNIWFESLIVKCLNKPIIGLNLKKSITMTKQSFIICLCFAGSLLKAQTVTPTVISNNGGYVAAAQGSIAWTIGEPISETYSTGANITTMGFHQPELGLASLIKEYGESAELLAYPNPVKESLTISFNDLQNGNYAFNLSDNIGRTIYKSETEIKDDSKQVNLNMSAYPAGVYFLNISQLQFKKTIKITKVN